MLADSPQDVAQAGALSPDLHLPATSLYELLDFIKDELPRWRDREERKKETAETVLTSQLCAHLNSEARHSYDVYQFRIEETDEQNKGRKIDLIAAPRGTVIWIEGRRHFDFDTLLPIECKRLPTPREKERDEREYVITRHASTGGIQRFKAGLHGGNHKLGAMIAYIQQNTRIFWDAQVAEWIQGLVKSGHQGWTAQDLLCLEHEDDELLVSVFRSFHARENGLPEIELRHLWIEMN